MDPREGIDKAGEGDEAVIICAYNEGLRETFSALAAEVELELTRRKVALDGD